MFSPPLLLAFVVVVVKATLNSRMIDDEIVERVVFGHF